MDWNSGRGCGCRRLPLRRDSGLMSRDVDRRGVVVCKHVPLLAHILLSNLLLEDRLEGELVLQVVHLPAQPLDVVVLEEDQAAPHGHRALDPDLGSGLDQVRQLPHWAVLDGLNRLSAISQTNGKINLSQLLSNIGC